jgi:hypothetical protein
MMNPAIYLYEAERHERNKGPLIHPNEICRAILEADSPRSHAREVLSSGCILIQFARRPQ